jgi:mono/diheme cytochrome c family protein
MLVVALGCCLLAAGRSPIEKAPAAFANRPNPEADNDETRRAGAKLYQRECAACHGQDRQGLGKAPALDRSDIRDTSPGALFWALRNGSLRRGMPSFAHLPEPERWQIIRYLQAQ